MEPGCPIDGLPAELLQDILSRLWWWEQLAVKRVSRRWKAAADACLARRQELIIDVLSSDFRIETVINECFALINSLQRMPNLRRLKMVFPSSSLLDSASVQQLCTSCPRLQEVIMHCRVDESIVMTLLTHLPSLRVLRMTCSGLECYDFLARLPAALESLSLGDVCYLDFTAVHDMIPCPQLRELHLKSVDCRKLENTLSITPHLERLSVDFCTPMSDWCSALSRSPELRDLSIDGPVDVLFETEFQVLGVLTVCSRLQRLQVNNCGVLRLPLPGPGSIGQRHTFDISHLVLGLTETNDDTFCRLAGLLPCLRYLEVEQLFSLTESGLTSGLRRLTKLETLHLGYPFIITPESSVLATLSDLPLEKLVCCLVFEPEAFVLGVASVLRLCKKLTLLYLPVNYLKSCQSLAKELVANPPVQNEVTLALTPRCPAPEDAVLMPGNVRVLKCDDRIDDEFYGWTRWR